MSQRWQRRVLNQLDQRCENDVLKSQYRPRQQMGAKPRTVLTAHHVIAGGFMIPKLEWQPSNTPNNFETRHPMKQCPRCPREYSDDLNFCLEDGARLLPKDDDKTWVMPEPGGMPQPQPTITAVGAQVEPGPTVAAATPQRSRTRKVLGAIVIILGVGLFGLIKIAPWSDRWKTPSAENTNTAPISFNFSPSATPPDNKTTPTVPTPSPSNAPSPAAISPTPTESTEPVLAPGVYGTKFQPNNRPEDALGLRTIRLVFTFNADGTYEIQAYLTLHGTGTDDRLYREERGRYTVTSDRISWRERIVRQFDYDNDVWKPWAVPNSGPIGADSIRNLTPTSFETYNSGEWLFVRKMY